MKVKCLNCNVEFEAKSLKARFHSDSCRKAYARKNTDTDKQNVRIDIYSDIFILKGTDTYIEVESGKWMELAQGAIGIPKSRIKPKDYALAHGEVVSSKLPSTDEIFTRLKSLNVVGWDGVKRWQKA